MAFARIDGIVAPEAAMALIFRRGPSKWTQLLTWDLVSDEVVAGQWIKGRVYTRRCDVSPDGRYLVGAFTNYSASHRNWSKYKFKRDEWLTSGWTAISRPPYFTAIGLWFTGGAWNGGGIWSGPRHVELNNMRCSWKEALAPPPSIKCTALNLGMSEDEPIFSMLMEKRGWKNVHPEENKLLNPDYHEKGEQWSAMDQEGMFSSIAKMEELLMLMEQSMPRYELIQEGIWTKPFDGGRLERRTGNGETWTAFDDRGNARMAMNQKPFGSTFLDLDPSGRIVYGEKGCLWAWKDFPKGEHQMVADLNENRFEEREAPDWAREG